MRFLLQLSFLSVALMGFSIGLFGGPTPSFAAAEQSQTDKAKIARYGKFGGPFALIDQHGKTVKDTDFIGKYMFIFFGYTSCPDVCPTTMQTISETLDLMGDTGKRIQPIMITVDPKRDTPDVLNDFSSNFSPRIIALTGKQKAIDAVIKNYGVVVEKVFDSPSHTDEDYSINHSAGVYFMNKKGKFLVVFPFGVSAEDMARNLIGIMKKY